MPHSEHESDIESPTIVGSERVWAGLLTNKNYLTGLLTLDFALKKVGSRYPFIVLYTDGIPEECHEALDNRGILKRKVPYLTPGAQKDYGDNAHYADVWTKLTIFSLLEYEKIILLDLDMLVIRNMDELFDIDLDGYPFAACHGCDCNPNDKPTADPTWPACYKTVKTVGWQWKPHTCPWTSQHKTPRKAQKEGPSIHTGRIATAGGMEPNAGLLAVAPSFTNYRLLLSAMKDGELMKTFSFPEQDLLAYVFQDKWLPLPYIYNAVKTMRWQGVHDSIWDDRKVKNIHYILKTKPWQESREERAAGMLRDPLHELWWVVDAERGRLEKRNGIKAWV